MLTPAIDGAALGTFIGGLVASAYGWRTAMLVVGLPGIALAVIVWLVVVEPRRGLADARTHAATTEGVPSLAQGFTSILASGPALHLVMAVTLTSMIGYGLTAWGPSFMVRSLGYSVREISLYVALPAGIAGAASAVFGGRLADRLARTRGLHAQATMVAVLKTLALPFTLGFFLLGSPTAAIASYLAYVLLANSYLGPTFALIQGLAPMRLRALWAAITLLVINLIGKPNRLEELERAVLAAFPGAHMSLEASYGGNRVLFVFNPPAEIPDWRAIRRLAERLEQQHGLDFPDFARRLQRSWQAAD